MNSTLAVNTAADVTALTTVERIKLELNITGADYDELLAAKIDDATSDIALRCLPSLKRETVTETFFPDRQGVQAEKLILRRFPVASVTSITLDEDLVDAAEYRLNDAGLIYRLTTSGHPREWWFIKRIAVVYVAGYLLPGQLNRDLPPFEAAAIELVSSYWASRGRDPAVMEEENVGVARFRYWVGAIGAAGDLPPGVMSKIQPFRGGMRA